MALTVRGRDAFGAQEEDKAFEQGLIGGQADGLEAFVGLLVRTLWRESKPVKATQSHLHAIYKPSDWEGIATLKPPSCDLHATFKPP